jgi:hypothetical protein
VPRLEFVTPAANERFIMTAGTAQTGPQMPRITARVRLVDVPLTPGTVVRYTWAARIRYPGTLHCAHQPGRTINDDLTAAGDQPEWVITFPRIRGGQLTIRCEARVNGQSLTAETSGLSIRGANPPRAQLNAALVGRALQQVCAHESGQRQFVAAAFTGEGDCPLWSHDNLGGVGLMQITNPRPSDDEVWSWLANVRRGQQVFREKLAAAGGYPAAVRRSAGFRNLVDQYNAARQRAGLPPVQIDLPDLTQEQLENDAIRGFNGFAGRDQFGNHLHEYRVALDAHGQLVVDLQPGTNRGTARWERVPAADRTAQFPRGYPGDADYVNHVRATNP